MAVKKNGISFLPGNRGVHYNTEQKAWKHAIWQNEQRELY